MLERKKIDPKIKAGFHWASGAGGGGGGFALADRNHLSAWKQSSQLKEALKRKSNPFHLQCLMYAGMLQLILP